MEPRRRSEGPDIGKYAGFKGSWDKDSNAFVFASMEERDRYQIATYGHVRNGWREDDEPSDERPLILHGVCPCAGCREYSGDIWRDKTERMTYEDAAEADHPRPEDTLLDYLARVSTAVSGRYKGVLPRMRRPGGTRVERERQLQKLRGQMPKGTEIL